MTTAPEILLRRQHHQRRHKTLVWALALAVLADAFAGAALLGWFASGVVAAVPLAAAALALLGHWLLRARRTAQTTVARDLDREWTLQARLESAAELSGDRSALAAAQRADTAAHLSGRRPPRALAWLAGWLLLAAAGAVFFLESTVFVLHLRQQPPPPPPAPDDISASIEWRSPHSEIKATAIEEIPLTAAVDSRTGFRAVSLEISVNGEPRLSRPLDAAQLAALAKAGAQTIELPLYLDEVGAMEFDVVAYHLRADRATSQPAPPVASPLQFIQVRPARDDVWRMPAGTGLGKLDEFFSTIVALKAAQLALLKQNFLLAHAPIAKTEPDWREANTTVTTDQATLARKTAEAHAYAVTEELHPLVVDHLFQATPLMEEAGRQIGDAQNESATKPQGRALGLLTEIEKIIQKVIADGGTPSGSSATGTPKIKDPFQDDQRYRIPPRLQTAAGQLEQLAQDQSELAQQVDSPPEPAGNRPPPAAGDQEKLGRRAEELARNEQLDPSARDAVAKAARDAAEATRQLRQGDFAAARAPAHAAAQALQEAAAAQDKAGRDIARMQLETARRSLNQAAQEPNDAARANRLADVAAQLQAEARAQQESGSAEAARQLAAAAAKIAEAARDIASESRGESDPAAGFEKNAATAPGPAEANTGKDEASLASSPTSRPGEGDAANGPGSTPGENPVSRAAQAATQAQVTLSDRAEVIRRAVRELQLGSGNASGESAGFTSGTTETEARATKLLLGAQLAHAALGTPESARLEAQLFHQIAAGIGSTNVVMTPDVRAAVDHLRLMLNAALAADRRDEVVRHFNPEDIDPAYREVVESYFERLSREARRP